MVTFISRSRLDISEQQDNSQNFKEKLMKFGLSLINLEKANVRLNAISLKNIFGSSDDIKIHLSGHYLQLIMSNIFKLVGQTNLLGNPVNFVSQLGTGV